MRCVLQVSWPRLSAAVLLALGAASGAACGDKKGQGPAPPAATASAALAASASSAAPPSPLSIVLESKGPLVLSGLEGGVFIADAAHTRLGRSVHGEIVSEPMPAGLPEGAGRPLRAAGRMPGSVWLLYETLREDGKVEANPLFRLGKAGFKRSADDWRPALAPWTKHRILAASTSSGRLKIKVIEPSLPAPPADLPSPQIGDPSCEQTLKVDALAAVGSGEVFAAGSCKPDTAAGAGASATRYVVVRWPVGSSARAADAGAGDAGAGDGGADERPGIVDVIPGVSTHLVHEALYARSASDVWTVARDPSSTTPHVAGSRLFRFDGATWGAVALPPSTAAVRGLAGTADGALWMVTERAIFLRSPAGDWREVPPPVPGAEPGVTWEMLDVASPDGGDVWIAARRTAPSGARDLVLRTRPAADTVRWE